MLFVCCGWAAGGCRCLLRGLLEEGRGGGVKKRQSQGSQKSDGVEAYLVLRPVVLVWDR